MGTKRKPTTAEIRSALDVLMRADHKDWPANPHAAKVTEQFRKERAKQAALLESISQTRAAVFTLLLNALPKSHIELFSLYGTLEVVPYTMNQNTFELYRQIHRKVQKSLAALERTAAQKSSRRPPAQ